MKRLALGLAAAGTALLLAGPAAGQSPQGSEGELRKLLDELAVQLDRAEKERLADPWFLRDLRDIVAKYDNPWRVKLLYDDFSARGPAPAPPWQVTAGEVLVDWRHGLRSVVEQKAAQAQPQSQAQQGEKGKDPTAALIGTILQQALGGGQQGGAQQQQQQAGPGYAAVIAPVPISNAFAIDMELSSRPVSAATASRFELGPYQGQDAAAGYRLAYTPGSQPQLALLRISSRGNSTLESSDAALNLQDGQPHRLRWTRAPGGVMEVSVDGQGLMRVRDQSFKDAFTGFALINAGGDYALRKISIDGTE